MHQIMNTFQICKKNIIPVLQNWAPMQVKLIFSRLPQVQGKTQKVEHHEKWVPMQGEHGVAHAGRYPVCPDCSDLVVMLLIAKN